MLGVTGNAGEGGESCDGGGWQGEERLGAVLVLGAWTCLSDTLPCSLVDTIAMHQDRNLTNFGHLEDAP